REPDQAHGRDEGHRADAQAVLLEQPEGQRDGSRRRHRRRDPRHRPDDDQLLPGRDERGRQARDTEQHQADEHDPPAAEPARHRPPDLEVADSRPRRRTTPITVDQVVDTALGIIAAEGYEALTMRRLAGALDTGPASLYAHVVNKADLDELLIGRLCAELA